MTEAKKSEENCLEIEPAIQSGRKVRLALARANSYH